MSLLLAIESAIAGGSLALFNNTDLVSSRSGDGTVSRAEDLLPNIVTMLDEAGVSKTSLSRIAVSLGPGSYTGLRIGIATVMGLKRALDIEYVGVPLFKALAISASDSLIAVPMGKNDVCIASSESPNSANVVSSDAFVEIIRKEQTRKILLHPVLAGKLKDMVVSVRIEAITADLADHIGRAALMLPPSESLDPIYVQNPRFG